MTRLAFDRLAQLFCALLLLTAIAACGSGAVSGPPAATTAITISPATATLYADLPTTFVISGGNGSYVVTSSDQAALPVAATLSGNTLTVVPNAVAADTPVTLTVRDTASSTPASATLTVKPRTVSNVVTVTPSPSQPAICGSAICAGGDAEVRVTLALGGLPLAGRTVRFDVISGDFRIIASAPGLPETLVLSDTATTDSSGTARIRVRALSDAAAQTGLLQITDVASGSSQRAGIAIAPSGTAALNAQPTTLNFQGVAANTCASGVEADVIVFGGRPPYNISQPGAFTVSPSVLGSSGERFTVTATGQCSAGSQIAIVDSVGATVSVTAINRLSDVVAVPPPTFTVSPTAVTLSSCDDIANVTIVGGSGSYFGSSSNNAVVVDVDSEGHLGTISRARTPNASPSTVNVAFSDGATTRQVVVTLEPGAQLCP